MNSGRVVAVGPGSHDREGKIIPVSVKEGDTVLLPEYGGTEVKLGEKEYHLYRDDDILGTLHH
ncbi:chaperonin [Lithospermum erythrorhizon]|uniref:Chaperonin n=1 Tax=Lithospermum erythrorhizon TaxID=34254 RepID=A0AAV3QDU8_LITER